MKDNWKFWLVIILTLALGAISGYMYAQGSVSSWHDPPPPQELLDANHRLHEYCLPTPYRILTCPDRVDACLCQELPPEF